MSCKIWKLILRQVASPLHHFCPSKPTTNLVNKPLTSAKMMFLLVKLFVQLPKPKAFSYRVKEHQHLTKCDQHWPSLGAEFYLSLISLFLSLSHNNNSSLLLYSLPTPSISFLSLSLASFMPLSLSRATLSYTSSGSLFFNHVSARFP